MKALQTLNIKPNLEGASLDDGIIIINIEFLWNLVKGEEGLFIKEFSELLTHEQLHLELRKLKIRSKFAYREEEIIREALGQGFSENERRFYLDKRKVNAIRFRKNRRDKE